MRKQYNSGSNYQVSVNKTQGSFVKQKSSSLNNPKETSQGQNQRIERSSQNNGQMVFNQGNMGGLTISDNQKAGSHFQQNKTTAEAPRDNLYKSMHKKVKSTVN